MTLNPRSETFVGRGKEFSMLNKELELVIWKSKKT
jgi:hypothetical protein